MITVGGGATVVRQIGGSEARRGGSNCSGSGGAPLTPPTGPTGGVHSRLSGRPVGLQWAERTPRWDQWGVSGAERTPWWDQPVGGGVHSESPHQPGSAFHRSVGSVGFGGIGGVGGVSGVGGVGGVGGVSQWGRLPIFC